MASLIDLINRLQTEGDAYKYLEEVRWPDGQPPACPHCGGCDKPPVFLKPADGTHGRKTRTGAMSQRRVWKCKTKGCRKQFSVLTNTPMHGTKISVRTWVLVTFEMCSSKNGVSAREIERKYKLTAKSAWFLLHRIREGMTDPEPPFWTDTTIVADETYVGGKTNRMNKKRRAKWEADNQIGEHMGTTGGTTGKTPVLSLINRDTGQVYSQVLNDVSRDTVRTAISEVADIPNIDLHTDRHGSYVNLGREARSHERADHTKGEYVTKRGGGTNQVESFFGQFKRSLDGTHHHVSRVHLHRYLAEFGFRHNTHQMKDAERIDIYYSGLFGKRLTYRPLVQRPDDQRAA
jgi:transposase-like protein